ncbi:MAG: site-2 protease family protein [Deltaproteobacteria bacterium]|nr:site-2 protease family protein [Deltaproteobacteria bacterium]
MSNGREKRPLGWPVNLLLFLATLWTTLAAGAGHEGLAWADFLTDPWRFLQLGSPFAFSLIAILGAHEMGHYLVARRYKVDVSLPFFIPIPTEIGTFGAVIKMRSSIPSRQALLDIAVAGPLAGFLVALPVLCLGILLSKAIPLKDLQGLGGIYFGEPLIYKILVHLLRNDPPDTTLFMNSFAFAGWIGLLVTFINLFPVGQLDGGHIEFALVGSSGNKLSYWMTRLLLYWGLLGMANWILWAGLGADGWLVKFLLSWCSPLYFGWGLILLILTGMFGARHPSVEVWSPLTNGRKVLAVLGILVFVLVLMPAPISVEVF